MKLTRREFTKAAGAGAVWPWVGASSLSVAPQKSPVVASSRDDALRHDGAKHYKETYPNAAYDFWYTAEKSVVFPVGNGSIGLVKVGAGEILAVGSTPGPGDGSKDPELLKRVNPSRLLVSRSQDKGLTWSPPKEIPAPEGTSLYFGFASTAVRLPTGRILVAVSNYDHDRLLQSRFDLWMEHTVHVYHSDDDGKTWHFGRAIDLPIFPRRNGLPSGELVCLGNTVVMNLTGPLSQEDYKTNGFSTVFIRSEDGGMTWSEPTILIRPGGRCLLSAEATTVSLPDGRWVSLIRHHVDNASGGVCLVRLESSDQGRTWSQPVYVLMGSQPCVRNLPGGGLVLSVQAWEGVKVYFSYDGGWTFGRNLLALDPYTEGIYVNAGYWNQSLLVLDDETLLSGFTSILPDDPDKRTSYGSRDPLKGFAGRVRVIRRERDANFKIPRKIAG